MKPEDLDELFRKNLEDKTTPVPAPLWDRLQEQMQAKSEHSVDKLFRNKLESHPTPLPPALWGRLEERMNPGAAKTRPMWVWYAAACLALLLSVTGVWRMQLTQPDLVAIETPAPATSPAPTQAIEPADAPSDNITNAPLAEATSPQKEVTARNEESNRNNAAKASDNTEKTGAASTRAIPPAAKQQPVKIVAPEPTQLAAEQPKAKAKDSGQPEHSGPIVIGAPQLAQAEPLKVDIILAAESEAIAQQAQPESLSKGAIAKGVVKQLLKLKKGEKPDLQEIGLASSYTMQLQTKNQTLSKTINL